MPSDPARLLLRLAVGPGDVPDRDLVARFAATRDGDAFAELVRRHGPMVLGVCRRVTGHAHDAEDAFQAAFVVLARRAGHLRRPDRLANWLYGVAYRTAREARAARRRVEERTVPAAPEPAARPEPDDTADLRRVVDEELARLPDKYRAAVVLCDLEGASRAAAAAVLGVPEGTLSSRLAHARKVLADRLTRRGVTATAPAVAAALGPGAAATAVPRGLAVLTARVARAAAAGAVPAGAVPASVSLLADGVLKTMLATRLRLALGAAAALGLAGLGAYGLAQGPAPARLDPPKDVPLKAAPPAVGRTYSYVPVPADAPPPGKAEKVAAKGIEDDDVPYPAFPAQAVVRVEDGKLVVRQRGFHFQPVTRVAGGQPVTSYERRSGPQAVTHDAADVTVFDMKGNRLPPKAWKEKLKADVHALVAFDGKLPNPRELALFKDDVLLVVLPGPAAPGGYGPPPVVPEGVPVPEAVPTAPAPPFGGLRPPAVRPGDPLPPPDVVPTEFPPPGFVPTGPSTY